MKIRYILLVLILVLFPDMHYCYSQISGASGRAMPENFRKFNLPSFGENVFVFDPSMDMKDIQTVIDTIFARQSARRSEFSTNRYALLVQTREI